MSGDDQWDQCIIVVISSVCVCVCVCVCDSMG